MAKFGRGRAREVRALCCLSILTFCGNQGGQLVCASEKSLEYRKMLVYFQLDRQQASSPLMSWSGKSKDHDLEPQAALSYAKSFLPRDSCREGTLYFL